MRWLFFFSKLNGDMESLYCAQVCSFLCQCTIFMILFMGPKELTLLSSVLHVSTLIFLCQRKNGVYSSISVPF